MKNRGTIEGDQQEIIFVQEYNKHINNEVFNEYNKLFNNYDLNKIYLCRVVTKQYSKLSNQVVMTRADAYAVYIDSDISDLLKNNSYYLDENILKLNNIKYHFINKSGISIKLSNSKKFQILKLTPNSFKSLFGNSELGAGASLYCQKEEELIKNTDLIKGWGTTIQSMCEYFSNLNIDYNFTNNTNSCKQIKIFSEQKIKEIIDSSISIQKKIFNGIDLYEEPYTAYYLYKDAKLTNLNYIPFQITTGSGRSKGIYTLVLKPL